MEELLNQGLTLKVTIGRGAMGCSDAQDACYEYGYLLLRKCGDNYLIDTPDDDNIVCVDDYAYIAMIVDTWEET